MVTKRLMSSRMAMAASRAAGQFPPQRYTMVTNCLISSRMATAASRAAC